MSVTFALVREWRASMLHKASDSLRADIRILEAANDALVQQAVPASYIARSLGTATFTRDALVSRLQSHLNGLRAFEKAVYGAAASVSRIENDVASLLHLASQREFMISADGTVSDLAKPPVFDNQALAQDYTDTRVRLRDDLRARVEKVLEAALAVDDALVSARPQGPFDDVTTPVVPPSVAKLWGELSNAERQQICESFARELAAQAGVGDFEIKFKDLEDQDGDGKDDQPNTDLHAYWRENGGFLGLGDPELVMDVNDLTDPNTLNTLAHEVRHGQQHHEVSRLPWLPWSTYEPPPGLTLQQVKEWEKNFDNYQDSDDDFDAYFNQPVETDARAAGKRFIEGLTAERINKVRAPK